MKLLARIALCFLLHSAAAISLTASIAHARPADFIGRYRILQSRLLSLTNGRGYLLQDGNLVATSSVNRNRVYCRSAQSAFDDLAGDVQVVFETAIDGTERALLRTIPAAPSHRVTVIECTSEIGFSGVLDLSVALGRVVELAR